MLDSPWSREQLARRLYLPTDLILDVLDRLKQRGLVVTVVSGKIRRYMPAYDMTKMPVREVIMAVRRNPMQKGDADKHIKPIPQAEEMMRKLDMAANEALGKLTMKEYVNQGETQELETKTVLLARQSTKSLKAVILSPSGVAAALALLMYTKSTLRLLGLLRLASEQNSSLFSVTRITQVRMESSSI